MDRRRAVLARNLATVRERITRAATRAGRDPDRVRLVAVTKTVDFETARLLAEAGVRHLGESRVDELVRKLEKFSQAGIERVGWHMIGHLQRNKVKRYLPTRATLHSLDSPRLFEELAQRLVSSGTAFRQYDTGSLEPLRVFIEVNVSGETTKGGVAPEQVTELVQQASTNPWLRVVGLMTMAPLDPDPETARPHFRLLRELRDGFLRHFPTVCELSMGMSQDYEVAVEEGATYVRIGTALFRDLDEA